jgi:hypothetical protein
MNNKKENRIRYDFSNKESQKLFEEFTVLLADLTKYVESQDSLIISKEKALKVVQGRYEKSEEALKEVQDKQKELLERLEVVSSGRYMVKTILKKSVNRINTSLKNITRKIVDKFKNIFK